ncbi:hypothetical protein [Streptomyces fagopyri]|uniref:hypothetical protein n=1 Tax=Streptomyces fagopyri TaxID=2662397 RepID=UPI0038270970
MAREDAGDRTGAEVLACRAADHGDTGVLRFLGRRRDMVGDREGAESLARRAAGQGHSHALATLAQERERTGDRKGAEVLARTAADLAPDLPPAPGHSFKWLWAYGLDPDGTPTSPRE